MDDLEFERRLKEIMTLRQLKGSGVSGTTFKYASERNDIMGDGYVVTQLITAEYNPDKDYILAKFLTEATEKYPPNYQYQDVDPQQDFALKYDPSKTYEIWITFYPVKNTCEVNGFNLDKEGIKKALEACYVKIWSNSPSFHWQGFNYNLSKKKAALFPTNIRPQKWDKIHGSALLDKHTYLTLQDIQKYYGEIADKALAQITTSRQIYEPEDKEGGIFSKIFGKKRPTMPTETTSVQNPQQPPQPPSTPVIKEALEMGQDAASPSKKHTTAVFSIGRMNPYTKGHDKLIDKMIATADSFGGQAVLFITQTQDNKKNPLDWQTKIDFIKRATASKKNFFICGDPEVKSAFDAALWLYNHKFTDIIGVFGSDRILELETMYNKYNGKDTPKGKYDFQTIQIVSAGDRDPDSDEYSSYSATEARNAAVDNDFEKFYQIVGTADQQLARELFIATRQGMGLEERVDRYSAIKQKYKIPEKDLRFALRYLSEEDLKNF